MLFDEIEKAHHDVFNVLLQVLDDGRITDGQGRTVDFKNTVIIMTSNIGSQFITERIDRAKRGRALVMEALRQHFRPEFLNRVDEIIIFDRLNDEDLKKIVEIQLRRLTKRLEAKDHAGTNRRRQSADRARRLRPGLRRAAVEAGDPERNPRSAEPGDSRRKNPRRPDRAR